MIQKRFLKFKQARGYRNIRRLVMRLQANVLARQLRRAFLKLKKDTITAQSFVRRFLVYTSYRCLKLERAQLIRDISGINTKLTDVSQKAALYFQNFDEIGGNTVSFRH